MTEPFKNAFNLNVINNMAHHFAKHYADLNVQAFVKDASFNLAVHELKQRSNQIVVAMQKHLPNSLAETAPMIFNALSPAKSDTDKVLFSQDFNEGFSKGIEGWAIMPIADYIGIQATLNKNDTSQIPLAMSLFKEVTKRFSAEFGIRYLLINFPLQTLAILTTWLNDPSQHVRRLISEGTRPRLPWGMQLPAFIDNPQPLINLLTQLKNDSEEYVRRSVANNINDIAKDHPELVNHVMENWLIDADKNTNRLIRHACRTLIKNGNEKTLKILGYNKANIAKVKFALNQNTLTFGQAIELQLEISSNETKPQDIIVDYIIHHQKANGATSPKTFKWKVGQLSKNKPLVAKKKHSIKKITTRVYYPGLHTVEIIVNGDSVASASFNLLMQKKY